MVPASGTAATAVYTSQTLVQEYLPASAIGSPPAAVSVATLTDMILRRSRWLDAKLWAKGFQVPYPDIAASGGPTTPEPIQEIATLWVAGQVWTLLLQGNRDAPTAANHLKAAKDALDALLQDPQSIGYGRVSTPENFQQVASVGGVQYGKMIPCYYRLANPNVKFDSIRFVNSSGAEVFRPEGWPFLVGMDYSVEDASQSILFIPNESQIIAACGPTGGVVYEFSWRRLSFGQCRPHVVPGVSRL